MKKVWFLPILTIFIFFASCRIVSLPPVKTPVEPFVELKDGDKYTGSSVGIGTGGLRNKISLDDTLFDASDVAFFSTGEYTYANIARKSFAVQVLGGKINLYRSLGGDRTFPYYVQKPGVEQVDFLTYAALKPMVEHSKPEYNLLQQYKVVKIALMALLLCTMAYFSIGFASAELISSLPLIIFPSVLGIIIESTVLVDNQNKLLRVVEEADGFEQP